jgi:hypothetical protein
MAAQKMQKAALVTPDAHQALLDLKKLNWIITIYTSACYLFL